MPNCSACSKVDAVMQIVEYQEAAMEAARQLAVTAGKPKAKQPGLQCPLGRIARPSLKLLCVDQPEGDGQTGDKATPSSMGRENTVETESVQDERSRVPETAGASVGHRRKASFV